MEILTVYVIMAYKSLDEAKKPVYDTDTLGVFRYEQAAIEGYEDMFNEDGSEYIGYTVFETTVS
jgi:hypothetical protein